MHFMLVWAAATFSACLESGEAVVADETISEAFAVGNEAVKDVAAEGNGAVQEALRWDRIATFCDTYPVACYAALAPTTLQEADAQVHYASNAAWYCKASASVLPFATCAAASV